MYHSFINSSSNRTNPFQYTLYRSTRPYQYTGNEYYRSKIQDDHILQRAKLQKPGFLIKQKSIYPEVMKYNTIGTSLSYATKLSNRPYHNFYSQESQQLRLKKQGINSFDLDQKIKQEKAKYLSKSSRSHINSNPNLGVRSYSALQLIQNQQANLKKSKNRSKIKSYKQQDAQQYIARSLLNNFGKIKQQESSDQDMFYEKQKSSNLSSPNKNKTTSRIINSQIKPTQLNYKGKQYQRII